MTLKSKLIQQKYLGLFLTSLTALMGCVTSLSGTAGIDQGGAITSSELTQKAYPYPTDLVAKANTTQLANYAWRLFIASMQLTDATLQNGASRGTASSSNNFIDSGKAPLFNNPLVSESLYHRTEAFPYYTSGNKPPSPIGKVPKYYTYYSSGGQDKAFTVSNQNYVNLDETNQISQNMLYYRQSYNPDFPVLYMAKVNNTEVNYVWNKQPPSSKSSFVFPNNVVEVKMAWRRVKDIRNSNPNHYHQAQATYYVSNGSNAPIIKTDTFALIAIHIIQKTANYQEFIFSTFEHVNAVTRDTSDNITDPAYQLLYTQLNYDTADPVTASATGAYTINRTGLPANMNSTTKYVLPHSGATPQGYVTVIQPKTISKEVNDVNNSVNALVSSLDSNSVWANYRLKGVQAIPTSNQEAIDFYLANIVVESSQPGIQLFKGNVGNTFDPLTNNRLPGNVSTGLQEGKPVPAPSFTVGGCQGCHGVAQQKGRDFSFLAQASGGVGKEVDAVPSSDLTPQQRMEQIKNTIKSSSYP